MRNYEIGIWILSMPPQVRKVRWFIGIISIILLLFGNIGSKIFENRTTKSIFSNPNLIQELGKDPADFVEIPERLDNELIFHIIGGVLLLGYLLVVIFKFRKTAFICLCFVFLYFLLTRLDSTFTLTQEEQSRGYTIGGWAVKIGSCLIPFVLEMVLISQGWIALRPRRNIINQENKSTIENPALKDLAS